jgi:hypothetical protein
MKKMLVLLVLLAMLVPPQPIISQATIVQTPVTSDPAMAVLYPEDLDPPESCGVPLRGPFGQDVEILVGPGGNERPLYQLYLNPSWYDQKPLPASAPTSDIAAVAQGTEQIVATWAGSGGSLFYNTWSASSGWSSAQSLGLTPDGNPALLSRNAYNWVVFARVAGGIKFRERNYSTLGDWMNLAGVAGSASAASDPVVISKDPNHMAVFYRDASGAVWFTEGTVGGGATSYQSVQASAQVTSTLWRDRPVSLSGIEQVYSLYLPLVTKNSIGTSFVSGGAASPEPDASILEASAVFTLTSELSVASRNENHLAVFGVSANHQLWVKEWTNLKESDWSDTAWVKLMDNVMVERPAVTSRHVNHLGVAVRDTSGAPWYIEWTYAAGWKTSLSLSGTRSNPLTIAATGIDTLAVFSVEGGQIWHKDWNETEGWGHWEAFTDTNAKNGQTLAATARQMDDLMLLGRRPDGVGFYKHLTSLGQNLREGVVAPGAPVSVLGDQALAWVNGKTLWIGADQDQVMTDTWSVEALDLTDSITASLALPTHPWGGAENQKSAMAAGDMDFDGDDEIVIATATNITPTFSISVLDFAVSPTLAITVTSTVTRHHAAAGPDHSGRLDVAIGDLDGDGRQDEVAMTYHLKAASSVEYDPYVILFEYMTATHTLDYRGYRWLGSINYSQDVRTTIGKVIDRHPIYGRVPGEQLIVANSIEDHDRVERHIITKVYSMSLTLPDWTFVELDSKSGPNYPLASQRWINYTTGDLDADGLEEIVYVRSGAVHVIDYDRQSGARKEVSFEPGNADRVNDAKIIHAVGDVDQDGKEEIAYWTADNRVAILDLVDENALHLSGSITPTVSSGDLLIGDLDGDSFRSDLAGCTSFIEVSVIAVLNGAPRAYASGLPVQDTDVRYAKTASGGSSSAWGTTTNLGGFLSVGFEVEINVPLIGTKLGEVRGSVTQDFMASQGQTRAVEESVTLSSGYNNADGQTLGIVVYNGTDYKCYYYDLYSPAVPAQKSRAMICRPIGNAYENFHSLEQWHSASFKQQAGSSWVDVGHRTAGGVRTNDANTYPPGLPVDPYLLKNTWPAANPFRVDYDVSGGYTDWSITGMQGASQESSRSFETNTTVSAGVTAGVVTVDAGVTVGFGWDESRSVSWSNELEIGGAVYKVSNPAFQTCVYNVVPYIYHAKATTLAGVTYPYLEMDYYVPSLEGNCGALSSLDAAAGLSGTR